MCMPNLMPENPTTAPRQSQPADAIPKPDSLKGAQKIEDYHKAKEMQRSRLGIISGLLGAADPTASSGIQQNNMGSGGGGPPSSGGK